MAAFEVAQTVGGADIAATLDAAGYATITIGATSGDGRISQDYDHLYLTFSSRNGYSAYFQYLKYEFNADNSNLVYSYTTLYAQTATVSSTKENPGSGAPRGITGSYCGSNSLEAGTFSTNTLWIPHYSNTSNFKTTFGTGMIPNTSNTDSQYRADITHGLWEEPDAITQIHLKPGALGGEFQQYTSYVLYGITGA